MKANTGNKRIAQNTLFLYIRMFLIMVVSLYTSRVVLQTLGVIDFGINNVVSGFVTIFSFINGSMIETSNRFIICELGKGTNGRINSVFNASLVIHYFIALFVILLCETIGLWFLYNKMVIPENRFHAACCVFHLSVITLFFTISQVPYNSLIIAHERMKIYAFIGVVEVLLKLIIVFFLLISPIDRLIFYSFLLFLLQLSIMLFYRFYCSYHYPESKFSIPKDKSIYRELLSFAGFEFLGSSSYIMQGQGVNILLNVFFGPVVNAARGIAFQVQNAVMQFFNNYMMAVRPVLTKEYVSGKYDYLWKLFVASSSASFYLMLFIILPICFEADYILQLWLSDYPKHADSFLILVLLTCLLQIPGGARLIIFKAVGKIKSYNVVRLGLSSSMIIFAFVWLKFFRGSPNSVFIIVFFTTLFIELSNMVIFFRQVSFNLKRYIVDVYIRGIAVAILPALLLFWFECQKTTNSFSSLIAALFISTISLVLSIVLFGFNSSTKSYVKNEIKTYLNHKIKKV